MFPTMYPILNQNMIYCVIFITEGYISATPSNNPYKGLIMIVLCYMFFHCVIYFLPSYYIIAEGSKSAALQTKPRIRENQKFTSRTLPRLRGGLLKTRVGLPEKT